MNKNCVSLKMDQVVLGIEQNNNSAIYCAEKHTSHILHFEGIFNS